MFLTLLAIYGISALSLIYILYQSVAKFGVELTFAESCWHLALILCPIANTAVVLLVAGWKVQGLANKVRREIVSSDEAT